MTAQQQTSIFDFILPKYKVKKPIRIIELFGGYGSQYMALKYLGANVESYKLVEWEVAAIEAYTRFHHEYKHFDCDDLTSELYNLGISNDGKVPMTLEQIKRKSDEWKQKVYNNIRSSNNLVNILTTKGKDLEIVEKDKYEYIMTYSFPCQDLSLAGKGAGLGEGTRSGLLWQVERILLELKDLNELPQILLMENVPMILSPKYKDDLARWDAHLTSLGYSSYIKNLIATDFLIPQTRNRTFMISILGNYSYSFPHTFNKKNKLSDFLEPIVDDKYFLSDKMIQTFSDTKNRNGFIRGDRFLSSIKQTNADNVAGTITTREGGRPTDNFIIIPEKTKKGYAEAHEGDGVYINRPHQKRGTVQKNAIQTIKTQANDVGVVVKNLKEQLVNELIESGTVKENDVINHSYTNKNKKPTSRLKLDDYIETNDNTSPTLTTRVDTLGVVVGTYQYSKSDNFMKGKDRFTKNKEFADTIVTTQKEGVVVKNKINGSESLRIRKLTPKECFRLMGVKDDDYYKIAKNQSNSSLYHLAGDSIVVNVLIAIFKQLL